MNYGGAVLWGAFLEGALLEDAFLEGALLEECSYRVVHKNRRANISTLLFKK